MIARRFAAQSTELAARESLLNQVVEDYGDGEFEPGKLSLSPGSWLMFQDMGCTSGFDICRLLTRHRGTLQLRAEVGDPSILAAAKTRLAECQELERVSRAALEDIEVACDDTEPALARQIGNPTSRLQSLIANREEAERHVAAIEAKRATLRDRAPQLLQGIVTTTVTAVQVTHSVWRQHEAVVHEILFAQGMLAVFERLQPRGQSGEVTLRNYCVEKLPAALLPAPSKRDAHWSEQWVNTDLLATHAEWLRQTRLPELQQEKERLAAEWAKVKAELEAPLDHWVQFGVVE
jgi:hypothetical protein